MGPWSILAPTVIRPLPTAAWKNSYTSQEEVAHILKGSPCLTSCSLRGMVIRGIFHSIWSFISSTTDTCTISSSRAARPMQYRRKDEQGQSAHACIKCPHGEI